MRCPFPACGQDHPADLETCPVTWRTLPRGGQEEEQEIEQEVEGGAGPTDARLSLRVGDRLIVTVPVGGKVVLGRRSPSPIASLCRDTNISRAHAELAADGPDEVSLTDIGSTNGTYVNDERLPSGEPRRLRLGDIVELANDPRLVLTVVARPEVAT